MGKGICSSLNAKKPFLPALTGCEILYFKLVTILGLNLAGPVPDGSVIWEGVHGGFWGQRGKWEIHGEEKEGKHFLVKAESFVGFFKILFLKK